MAQLNILIYPDSRLRKIARPVSAVDDAVRKHVGDMAETMYVASGIGLASIQVNIPESIIVIDISKDRDDLQVLINPEIIERRGEQEIEEGCLSFPGYFDVVKRSEWVRFRALDCDGLEYEKEAEGLLAVCVQHEMDHLNGKLFADYLSRLKRERLRKQFEKQFRTEKRRNAERVSAHG